MSRGWACCVWLCSRNWSSGRHHGDLWSRCDEPGHAPCRCAYGFDPIGCDHRSGGCTSRGTDAFQEADIVGITLPVTKHNFLVTDPAEIPRTIAEAFHIAQTGRPGPVLVDIAKSAMQAQTRFEWPSELNLPGYHPVTKPHSKQIREAARLIASSRKPVLYVGAELSVRVLQPSCADWLTCLVPLW